MEESEGLLSMIMLYTIVLLVVLLQDLKKRKVINMVVLKEINLDPVRKQLEVVKSIQSKLDNEREVLKEILVTLNLDYYGTDPFNYYKTIKKDYITEDGYSVKIENKFIHISKRVKSNLIIKYIARFEANAEFSLYDLSFEYDSGRSISIKNQSMVKKNEMEIERMKEIYEGEKIFNPFKEFQGFYGILDFHRKDQTGSEERKE